MWGIYLTTITILFMILFVHTFEEANRRDKLFMIILLSIQMCWIVLLEDCRGGREYEFIV